MFLLEELLLGGLPRLLFGCSYDCIISAIMLKKTKAFEESQHHLSWNPPDYHMPSLKSWAMHVWERISAYIIKAGTIIFVKAIGIWVLSNLAGLTGTAQMEYSISKVFRVMMYGRLLLLWFYWIYLLSTWIWKLAGNCGFLFLLWIAKGNLVSTFGVLYGLGDASRSLSLCGLAFAGISMLVVSTLVQCVHLLHSIA